jgi:pilus assembly protein Flp/PilA
MRRINDVLIRFWIATGTRLRRTEGQALVSYALMLVLISIVSLAILMVLGNQVKNVFSNISAAMGGRNCTVAVIACTAH